MKSWKTRWSIILGLLILALWWNYFAGEVYAKVPTPKAYSCEDKALFVAQVIHAKQRGKSIEWINQAISDANELYNDPEIKTTELLIVARWAYTYKGSEDSGVREFMLTCLYPTES